MMFKLMTIYLLWDGGEGGSFMLGDRNCRYCLINDTLYIVWTSGVCLNINMVYIGIGYFQLYYNMKVSGENVLSL